MPTLKVTRIALALTALAMSPLAAQALSVNVSMAGWQASGGYGASGNSQTFLSLPAGSTVTGFDYLGLAFATTGDSWQRELVLSVNNQVASTQWLDWQPSTTAGPGSFGAASGSWGGATGVDGPFPSTGPFVTPTGSVFVTAYLSYTVPPVGISISQGTLRVQYDIAPVPEPTTVALMLLGLAGVGAASRRLATRV
ncbi:MAG: PEP-CTERM sorting domain-containing protein [Rubrivivax sp.]